MLSSQKYIDGECKKSGRKGRFDYLQALVTEFQDTSKKGKYCSNEPVPEPDIGF